jgi:hypothetical protein
LEPRDVVVVEEAMLLLQSVFDMISVWCILSIANVNR